MNKSIYLGALAIVTVFTVSSCKRDPLSPGLEYMPDMYRSPGVETYSTNPNYADGMSAQQPVKNTIPRGFTPYPYPNTPEAYELAGQNLKNPLTVNEDLEKQGKVIYTAMCVHCHGSKGDGAGTLKVKGDPFPVPSYYDAAHLALPDGKMFHSITWGKGLMGSHASQITQEDRWKLVAYVNRLQREGAPGAESAPVSAAVTDSTKASK
jgi:mono/diheme cytochrome c family protein